MVFQLFPDGIFKTAKGSTDNRSCGQCIPGIAAMDLGNTQYCGVGRVNPAADDGLQLCNQMRCCDQHIIAQMRHRSMRGPTVEIDFKVVKRSHHGSRLHSKMTHGKIRKIMHAENPLHRELLKQSFTDHLMRTRPALFRRLENKINRSVKPAVTGQIACRP